MFGLHQMVGENSRSHSTWLGQALHRVASVGIARGE